MKERFTYIYIIYILTYLTVLLLRWYIGVMHRWIATVMTALLRLRTRLRCIAPCWCVRDWCELQGAGRSRKQIWLYDIRAFQVQPFNHIRNLGQRVHEHLLPGIHHGGRGFQWFDDWFHSYSHRKDAVATALSEHSIHFDSAFWGEGKQTQVFAKLCPWVIDVGVIPASLVSRTFLTYKVPCHLCIWCKYMPNAATCTAFWFWLITLRAKAFKCSRLKNVGKSKVLTHERVFWRILEYFMFCSWDVRIQNASQYQLRHHRVWISLDFPDKSEVMCRCGYKHDGMIVWTYNYTPSWSQFSGNDPFSHPCSEESFGRCHQDLDGPWGGAQRVRWFRNGNEFWVYDMFCFEVFQSILLRKCQLRSTAIKLGFTLGIIRHNYAV